MFDDCVIMAGGSGTRLWPASSGAVPKQFLPIGESGSFFNAALERAFAVTGNNGRVIIVAGASHAAGIRAACGRYAPEDRGRAVLIVEPLAKNTAPAIACAAVFAAKTGGGSRKLLVLTSDHVIEPLERFLEAAAAAKTFADGALAVFGIRPRRPETGYGYIEAGERLSEAGKGPAVFAVTAFREKPDRAAAERFLAAGNFFWNSGMFAFSSSFILNEFERNAPGVIAPFTKLGAPPEEGTNAGTLRILENWPGLEEAYRQAESVSFDYAIAEKCSRTVMVESPFTWTDVGSWDEYAALAGTERGGLCSKGTVVYQADSSGCFVDADIPVALAGVQDLIIAVRSGKNGGPAAVLVAKRGETQKVRDIVAQIKADGGGNLL
jgi:mannose-1-phosphate guanylyltransferase/mannose-6-phosphate isomerase